ncbi:hypothetical protein HME9304_03349 [Flagellimonas maritima]|uniref:DUF2914 domain-containing protein n=1 Tax=Flagellimonas maritima TaxID=1383885 RepID=A0A2Z4LX74_9FLAO|nr:DUF2914 domain-containing protein [Allomuricauda aurantiaca]AWX46316.1 hypothetical protein HME9304_03349 [Allomuricauda aurantiaca]
MKRTLVRYRNSKLRRLIRKHEKYAPVLFFIGGFIFDSLTLGRIDRLYDLIVLCLHMTALTIMLYIYNLVDDGKWKNSIIGRYDEYLPLAIQFFFGGLSSAYVIYFSRSVSLSKTVSFFVILVLLLFANEFLKKRISNKYLQFGVYFFINFTFFAFMVPVFIKEMNTNIFLISGAVSLVSTLILIVFIYLKSPSTRAEVGLGKLIGIVFSIYITINLFYLFRLIPPVPLALENGIVAHDIKLENNNYIVSYEADGSHIFWRRHRLKFIYKPEESVYVFSSIFAPTDIEKSILHRWKWYDPNTNDWKIVEDIGYDIVGGRDGGYRGYTFKNNVKKGTWRVEVITEEELVLGVINFEIVINPSLNPKNIVEKKF